MNDIGQGNEIAEDVGRVVKKAFLKYRLSVLEEVRVRANALPEWTDRDADANFRRAVHELERETEGAIEEED